MSLDFRMAIDESSRLKQFLWEELEDKVFIAVLFRSNRRYVVQRYFEHELTRIKSSKIQQKWRQSLSNIIQQTNSRHSLTQIEINLMNEILSWHLNLRKPMHFNRTNDYLIDFDDLLEHYQNEIMIHRNSQIDWIQIDSKLIPFVQKYRDYLLPIEYLLKENVISSYEDNLLKSFYIPMSSDDFNQFGSHLTQQSSFITLEHLVFRLKRLIFIRFHHETTIDHKQIMRLKGGLLTLNHFPKQRIPYIYINQNKYIPQIDSNSSATFCLANQYEFEYLRLIMLYDSLATDVENDYAKIFVKQTNLTLIPIDCFCDEKSCTNISLKDFHFHEYQRRFQQEKNLSNGRWQTPRSSTNFQYQQPILF